MKVFITGISKGIGKALAREIVACGHEVWGVARSEVLLQELQAELGADKLRYSVADLSNSMDVEAVIKELKDAEYYPDEVYLNAGLYSTNDATFSTKEHNEMLMRTNMQAPIQLYKAFSMFSKPPKGVVLISSLFALLNDPVNRAYYESKAGVSKAFKEFKEQDNNSQIKIVYLGPVDTQVNELAESKGSAMLAKPESVAKYLADLMKKGKGEYIHPFTAWGFYQVFRFLPMSFYNWVMLKLRR